MDIIKIDVSNRIDGYTLNLLPSARVLIKILFPDANPANTISVSYNTLNFKIDYDQLQSRICTALLGINNLAELQAKVSKIIFVDSRSEEILQIISSD